MSRREAQGAGDRSPRRATGREGLAPPGAGRPDTAPGPAARHPWLLELTEADQLFLSWPVAPAAVAGRIPAPLSLETFDARAWITLVAFRMERLRLRGLPPVPLLSSFAEVGCLTCVRLGDERGVWFLRLDAATRLGSAVGRRLFALPYHHSAVSLHAEAGWRWFRSAGPSVRSVVRPEFRVRYRPTGPEHEARPGTLAHFVAERSVMFSGRDAGALLRAVQARPPRRIRACEVVLERNTLHVALGLPEPADEPVAWYCSSSVIRIGLSVPVRSATPGR